MRCVKTPHAHERTTNIYLYFSLRRTSLNCAAFFVCDISEVATIKCALDELLIQSFSLIWYTEPDGWKSASTMPTNCCRWHNKTVNGKNSLRVSGLSSEELFRWRTRRKGFGVLCSYVLTEIRCLFDITVDAPHTCILAANPIKSVRLT